MDCAGTVALTHENLSFPDFSAGSACRVASFVRSQEVHLSNFACEGRAFYDSWNTSSSAGLDGRDTILPIRMQGIGFSSPVLQARAARIQYSDVEADPGGLQDYRSHKDRRVNQHRSGAEARSSKKLVAQSPDSEHAARLEERRGRKRVKRAIVKPVVSPDSTEDKSSSDGGENGKRRRRSGAKKKKAKIDSELTLMQCFSAKNIGKERLTLKPGPGMGVFNKGKASTLMRTNGKKRKSKIDHTFSEYKFLNKTGSQAIQFKNKRSSSSSSSSCTSGPRKQLKHSQFFSKDSASGHEGDRRKATHTRSEGRVQSVVNLIHVGRGRLDIQTEPFEDVKGSEIWDIELEKPLPSDDGDSIDQEAAQDSTLSAHLNKGTPTSQPPRPNNVVLKDEKRGRQGPHHNLQSLTGDPSPVHSPSGVSERTCSPSLGPSCSASQQALVTTHSPQYDTECIESTRYQQRMSLPSGQCLSASPKAEIFRFRPVNKANPIISPASEDLLFPLCAEDDDDSNDQIQTDILLLNPEADYQYISKEILNGDCRKYLDQQSQGLAVDEYFDHYHEDDETSNCFHWQEDGSEEDMEMSHDYDETQEVETDLIHYDVECFEAQSEYWDSPDPSQPGGQGDSSGSEAWAVLVDDNRRVGADRRMDTAANHALELWTEPDPTAASPTNIFGGFPAWLPEARAIYDAIPTDFIQGRSLLFGVEEPITHVGERPLWGTENAEYEVLGQLKDHWLPQRL